MKKLKMLGLAVVAALVTSAMACVSATATALYRNEEEDIHGTGVLTSPVSAMTETVTGGITAAHVDDRDCERTTANAFTCGQSKVSHEVKRRDISLF